MFPVIESGMNIESVFVFVIERPLPKKLQMFCRELLFDSVPGFVDISFAGYHQGLPRILLKRTLSSSHRRDPNVSGAFDKVEQHLLMISAQAGNTLRIVENQLSHMSHAPRCVGPTVDEIAKKYEGV